ncbi:MAG: nuclear transport factor 2 family protein [Hyphomicrobiaceae bacterium]
MDNRAIVESFLACWSVQDVEMTIAHVHDDFVYALYISETALPYGGETRGKDNVRAVLFAILAEFDYLRYDAEIIAIEGDVVRASVAFVYHHRRTGENLSGTKRMVLQLKDGLITRIDEYHDAAKVEAFMRLAAQRTEADEVPTPPELPKARRHRCSPR